MTETWTPTNKDIQAIHEHAVKVKMNEAQVEGLFKEKVPKSLSSAKRLMSEWAKKEHGENSTGAKLVKEQDELVTSLPDDTKVLLDKEQVADLIKFGEARRPFKVKDWEVIGLLKNKAIGDYQDAITAIAHFAWLKPDERRKIVPDPSPVEEKELQWVEYGDRDIEAMFEQVNCEPNEVRMVARVRNAFVDCALTVWNVDRTSVHVASVLKKLQEVYPSAIDAAKRGS
jgi:hypothetical protein